MKKLLSLLAVLMLAVTSAWAGETFTYTLNGKAESSPSGFFSYDTSGKFSFNTKYNGCTYDGVEYTSGLKMEGTTKILFTTTEAATVTIVQSNWSDKTIKFDDTEYSDRTAGTGCFVYTIKDVKAGEHNIMRGSGEAGLFLVKVQYADKPKTVTFTNDASWNKVYAYAWSGTGESVTKFLGDWPGTEMTPSNASDYTLSFMAETNPEFIIFNDNGQNQTADLEFKDGGVYNSTGRIINLNDYSATFSTDGMDEVYAYVWNGEEKVLGEWPGTKMEGGNGKFSIDFKAEDAPKYIIFHDNLGNQTPDWAFEDGKAYEYMLQDFSVSFTTDAEWADTYVYMWTGEKVYTNAWPGTKMSSERYEFKAFVAPDYIQFNNGEAKTGDLKFVNNKAYEWITAEPLYKLNKGDSFKAGTTVEVTDADKEVVATITYGSSGNDFTAATESTVDSWAKYGAMTAGNGTNGDQDGGTSYTIVPKYDGTISVAVRLNGGKKFYVMEDGTALAGYDGITIADAENTTFSFAVSANKSYKFYCAGSKLGFFGFDYKFKKPEPQLNTYTATFKTNAGWESVKAYAWTKDAASGEVTEFLGGWPGKDITETLAEGVYTLTFKAAAAPDSIIFNNGAGEQTADLAFEDGKAYNYQLFTVSVAEDIQGGSIGVNPEKCVAGTAVEVYVKPGEDLVLNELYYIGATTQRRADIVDETFFMPEEDVVVYATFKEAPQPEVLGYYVVGNMNEWSYDEAYQMQESPTAQGIYEFTAQFAAGDEFKVLSKMSEGDGTWYPAGMGNNWTVTQDGEYTITFDPNGNQEWQNGFFNVVMKEEPIVVNDYTVQFVNGAGWENVYAYTWSGDGITSEKVEQLGRWAGTEMGLIDTEAEIDGKKYPVYELKFSAAVEPDSIVFSNGRGGEVEVTQTKDYEFFDDYRYQLIIDDTPVNPEETSYTIKFKDAGEGNGDGTAAKTSIEDLIADGADYVKATTATKAYNGKEGYGVKLGSSKDNGSMTLTLAQSVKPTKITFKASAWVNSNDVADAASISINGKDAQELTKDLTEYTVNYDGETEVSEIAIAATKRAYITELTVTYVDESGGDQQPFSVGFTTDKEWKQVFAYIWKGGIEAPNPWPGVEITETKDGDTYYYAFQSTYAPDFIIFNNGTEAEVKEQTSDLVFEDGANYSLTTEKTTAWAGDPEVAISTTTGITIPAKAFEKADVQAEKIIHIVAKEISTAAPAKGFNSDVAELKPTDIAILKNEEPFDKVLIEETAIQVVDDGYQFVADNAVAQEITDHGFVIKPLGDKQIGVEYVEVEKAKAPAAVVNIDFAPAPTDDIGAVIEARAAEITAAGNKVGNITITLGAIGTPYTTTKAIVAPAGVLIQGAGPATSIIDASGLEGDLITLSGSETFAKKADDTDSDHYLIGSVEINNLKIAGLKGTLITDAQKTLLEKLTINNAVVEMPAAAKNVINFNGKGYVGEVVVKNSTIYANGHNTGFFAQYGSRPKNVNGDWLQTFDVQNSTIVGIAYGKNVCDLKQNGTAQNVYTLKNNIFVDFGKSGQVVVGFNKGQTSATPVWNVDNNIFNFDGADKAAAEVEKAGKVGEEDIVKNSVAGVVTFTDAANGDFNGTFALGEGASEPATKPGDPRWTITYATPVEITTMSIVGEFTGGWPVQDPETSAWDWSMAKAMTQDAENANIWTLEMPFVAEAKKYEYKAAANSNWNDYVLPLSENANFIFGTDEYPAGEYILTFTADTKNHTVGVVAKWNGPEDIKVVPEEGSDISTAVQTASEGKKVKDIYVYLAPGKKFTISKSIVAPAAFVIMGAADGTNPSDIDENATMAEIDASTLDGPMVKMSETPAVAADANGFYPLADVGFLNVKVTGLTQQLFYANKQKYLINCFHVDFCNINVAGGSKTIIDTNGGGVIATLDMSKNTIWANPENTGALYSSQSGQKATEAGLAVQTFNIEKNTMYNIAKGKNFCSHRQSNQTWLTYNVKNNTFVNCGKSGQVIKGLNGGSGGANPTWNVDGNAFNFEGADTSANEETGDADEPVKNSLAGVFTFTDAAAGDFNGVFKSEAAEAPAKYPGDPRWTYTYESTAPAKFYLIGSMNNWDRTALTEMTFNETTQAYEYEYAPTEKVWFAFADKQLTAEEATADPEWADFNANHRYAIGAGDVNATLNEAIALQKVNGTLVLEAGSYKISVAKDLSTVTITGEAPETTYTVAGSFYYADGSVAIFGTEWDVANTANDMEKQLDGTYKKVYTIDFPFAGNIQFKVAENHAWDVSYGWDVTAENPDGNAFYNVASPANGATVTITFDPNGATAADKVKIEVTGIPTVGINGIVTDDADDNAPIYNLAGQKVDKNYKGVVIKNGKKIYQK